MNDGLIGQARNVQESHVVRIMRFSVERMLDGEAIDQMQFAGHDFYPLQNA